MFACIYGRTLAGNASIGDEETRADNPLVDLAFTFSPLVEQTMRDTVVVDIEGQEHLFCRTGSEKPTKPENWIYEIADRMRHSAQREGLKVNVAIAANPDAAIHAAHAFDEVTVVPRGKELDRLSKVPLKLIDYSLAGIDEQRAEEIRETFASWGVHTFGDLARLPVAGVAQRLGQEGVRLQKFARGCSGRNLVLVQPPIGFEQSLELEHPISELEPLSFILSRLLNQLCANLNEHALATNELRVRLVLEPRAVATRSIIQDEVAGNGQETHERTISLPVPMRNARTFVRLCLLDLESHPPQAPVTAVAITAEPTKPRVLQNGLFIPLAPEPEKLELTLARLAKLVGSENVGSPELLDTHRPDAFRIKRFNVGPDRLRKKDKRTVHEYIRNKQKTRSNAFSESACEFVDRPCVLGFRRFRPPAPAQVTTIDEQPTRINAHPLASSDIVRGKVIRASGPWRASGDWWRSDVWGRDEWDVTVESQIDRDGHASPPLQILCRIYRDLISAEWFVEGIYD